MATTSSNPPRSKVEDEIRFHVGEFIENHGVNDAVVISGPPSPFWGELNVGDFVQFTVDGSDFYCEASNPANFIAGIEMPRKIHEKLAELGFEEELNYVRRFPLPDLRDRAAVDQHVIEVSAVLTNVLVEAFGCPPDFKVDVTGV